MIEVWHAVPRTPGDEVRSMLFTITVTRARAIARGDDPEFMYQCVAKVETTDHDKAYELTNTIYRPWWQNPEVYTKAGQPGYPKGYRSTSVGDMFVSAAGATRGQRYVVMDVGFEPVNVW